MDNLNRIVTVLLVLLFSAMKIARETMRDYERLSETMRDYERL